MGIHLIDKGLRYCPETISCESVDSPVGAILVASTSEGICFMGLSTGKEADMEVLHAEFPSSQLTWIHDDRHSQAATEVFHPSSSAIDILLWGTPLQKAVWKALLQIPRNATVSYERLSLMAGYPRAIRAVASAVGRNRIAPLLPCHRVVRKSGAIGQYRWGVGAKMAILGYESLHFVNVKN